MEKRGPYKGANKNPRGDVGTGEPRKFGAAKSPFRKLDARAAGAKPDARTAGPTRYPDLEKRFRREEADRAALSRVTVLAGDEVALGCNSSDWAGFAELLREKFRALDAAKIEHDRIAAIWNKDGFKTGAGQRWTARLVDVAKIKLAS